LLIYVLLLVKTTPKEEETLTNLSTPRAIITSYDPKCADGKSRLWYLQATRARVLLV
jgi:hypothetical protein